MAPKHALYLSFLSLLLGGCVTCATDQDWKYKFTQKHRAAVSYTTRYTPEQRRCLGCDFHTGFKAGYFETAIGRDCRVPPVAPPKYWSAHYQSCEGQKAVQDWFRGYQEGIAAASADGYRFFNEVPVSGQAPVINRTACGMCQSLDPCNCFPGSPLVEAGSSELPGFSDSETQLGPAESVMESQSLGFELPRFPRKLPAQGSLHEPIEIGLIGGFGAVQNGMYGPADPKLFQN